MSTEDTKVYTLKAEEELRLECDRDQGELQVKLVQGTAELFGTELALDRMYTLKNQKVAIFTWNGCVIEIFRPRSYNDDVTIGQHQNTSDNALAYTSNDTPMRTYLNTHASLEAMRERSSKEGSTGPRFMVVGESDSGKNVLCYILANYATRLGRSLIFIDLDPNENVISCPGTLAATPLKRPMDIEQGFNTSFPLSYFFGHTAVSENTEHYSTCVKELSKSVIKRLALQSEEQTGGIIVNSSAWADKIGLDGILDAVDAFKIDVLAVIGHERLYARLSQTLQREEPKKPLHIFKLAKSGGVVSRDESFKRQIRVSRFKQYFYGSDGLLKPRQQTIKFSEVGIYRVGGQLQAPSSALPIGEESLLNANEIVPVLPSMEFSHSILAVSHAKTPQEIMTATVAGFVYVSAVDVKRKILTILAPSAHPLPTACLLFGTLKWHD